MKFFNKITDFLFRKEKPTELELSPEEILEISNKLLSKYGSVECLMFVLLGAYLGASNSTNDNVMQRVEVLMSFDQDLIIRFNQTLPPEILEIGRSFMGRYDQALKQLAE